jgi:hypothetical protein
MYDLMFNRITSGFVVRCGKCNETSHVQTTIQYRKNIPISVLCPKCDVRNFISVVTEKIEVEYSVVEE